VSWAVAIVSQPGRSQVCDPRLSLEGSCDMRVGSWPVGGGIWQIDIQYRKAVSLRQRGRAIVAVLKPTTRVLPSQRSDFLR
jgi:hypothetical protein